MKAQIKLGRIFGVELVNALQAKQGIGLRGLTLPSTVTLPQWSNAPLSQAIIRIASAVPSMVGSLVE
jgi:hypothetical protein